MKKYAKPDIILINILSRDIIVTSDNSDSNQPWLNDKDWDL